MKNDEIKQANRKALPEFLLFAVVCTIVGGVIGYYSGYALSGLSIYRCTARRQYATPKLEIKSPKYKLGGIRKWTVFTSFCLPCSFL